MENYKNSYKDYSKHVGIMISTDRTIFLEKSAVRVRMIEHARLYKELHIIVFSIKKFEQEKISDNCTIYSSNSLSKLQYVSSSIKIGKKILKKLDKEAPVVFTCQDPFETGLVGKSIANARKNSELLLQVHTDLFSPHFPRHSLLNRIRLHISKHTLLQADTIRVVSKKIADSLVEKGSDPQKIIVKPIDVNIDAIRNGVPTFNLREKFPQFGKIVLMVSRIEPEKNIDMALDAMKIVLSSRPDTGLVIVGSGSKMQSLRKQACRLKIEASVSFVGWQTDLIPYYNGCDIFLMTSWFEGYGMVLKEAEVAGCKIVSTDVGVAREIGSIICDWQPSDIAKKITETLS